MLFLHGGKALLTGSDVGRVRVYDIATTLQVDQLNHSKYPCTRGTAAYWLVEFRDRYHTGYGVFDVSRGSVVLYLILIPVQASFTGQRRRIATGSSETGEATYIKLWEAPGRRKYGPVFAYFS